MSDRPTIDSNILIYAFAKQNDFRKGVAIDIIESCDILSLQALNETIYVLRKKFNFTFDDIDKIIDFLKLHFVISEISLTTLKKGITISKKYQLSFWDSMMIAAAIENRCTILFSEDLQHEQIIEGKLKIINPFKGLSPTSP